MAGTVIRVRDLLVGSTKVHSHFLWFCIYQKAAYGYMLHWHPEIQEHRMHVWYCADTTVSPMCMLHLWVIHIPLKGRKNAPVSSVTHFSNSRKLSKEEMDETQCGEGPLLSSKHNQAQDEHCKWIGDVYKSHAEEYKISITAPHEHRMQLFSTKLRLSLSHSMILHQDWDSMHVIMLMSGRRWHMGWYPLQQE